MFNVFNVFNVFVKKLAELTLKSTKMLFVQPSIFKKTFFKAI